MDDRMPLPKVAKNQLNFTYLILFETFWIAVATKHRCLFIVAAQEPDIYGVLQRHRKWFDALHAQTTSNSSKFKTLS